ncbi:MAG: nitroreductase family protein [Faecalibacillus sp.]
MCIVIVIGYAKTQGISHKSKQLQEVMQIDEIVPERFKNGVEVRYLHQ